MATKKNKILFVINPISGDKNKTETEAEVLRVSKKIGFDPAIFHTTGKNDIKLLKNAIDNEKPDIVVAVGGDGTCNLVGTTLRFMNLKMGIIPFGSANGMARTLEIPNELVSAMNIIENGKTRKVDLLKVNDRFAMHLSDVGLNARIIRKFEKNKTRGLRGYARQFLKEIFSIQAHKYYISFGDNSFTAKALMIVIANANKFGTGAIINPHGKIDDGKFEIIIIKPYRSIGFLRIVKAFLTGDYTNVKFVEIHQTNKAHIMNVEKQTLQVDGEIAGKPGTIELSIEPQSLEILVP